MSLSIGIVGLPNVGKSTLFQTLTKKQVDCSNYPFCTIDPNVGVVAVPDKRVDQLAELLGSAKKIYATVEFVDIAGLVKGASQGEGLGNKFLANIRETDAIVYVLRCFINDKIISSQTKIDPLEAKEILDAELILKDLETIEKRAQGLEKEAKAGKKDSIKELSVLLKTKVLLEKGAILAEQNWQDEERKTLKQYQLLTLKPRLYLLNGDQGKISPDILTAFKKNNWPFAAMDIKTEFEAADFTPEERKEFGLPAESGLDALIKKSYQLLDLITFFTAGEKETRAWTLKRNFKAPQAGGAIHSDFEEKFIRAEVINWQELIKNGGRAAAKEKGLLRAEGKEYIIQDGDVIEIKI
jgi:GTP-binding protein YchF